MLTHSRMQHPVGQGFFHSGELAIGNTRFRYVYDCGSENVRALRKQITSYTDGEQPFRSLDVFFVSHLDEDHVNGLDRFLTAVTTHTVVLPYLSDADVFALAGEACLDGAVDSDFVSFLADPVAWLGNRGVSRVIFVTGNDSDSLETPAPGLPDDPTFPDNVDGIRLDLDEKVFAADEHWERASALLGQTVQVAVLPHHRPLTLRANGRVLNWGFISFVHPDFERKQKFIQRVADAFPKLRLNKGKTSNGRYKVLSEILRDPGLRATLADCYLVIRKNRNLTSMSLYSGPFKMLPDFACRWSLVTASDHAGEEIGERCGWVGTGDSDLRSTQRRRAFLRHYQGVLQYAQTMSLPHHGSRHNFSVDLLEDGPPVFVASAGESKRYGHPHNDVLLQLKRNEKRCFVTTEAQESTVLESVAVGPVVRGDLADLPPEVVRAIQQRLLSIDVRRIR